MSWNEYLYHYHKKHGGTYLGGQDDDGLLVFTWKDRPLAVDLFRASGQYGPILHVQARIPVTLVKPYKLTIGAEKKLSGGVNTLLKAVPIAAGFATDYGYPEVTKKRLIRSDNQPFTKLVLGSLDFRNALLACPGERVEVRSGPGREGLHLITVTTDAAVGASITLGNPEDGWYLNDYAPPPYASEEEKRQADQRMETEFFPKMDRFLDLTRAAYNAVTQWPM